MTKWHLGWTWISSAAKWPTVPTLVCAECRMGIAVFFRCELCIYGLTLLLKSNNNKHMKMTHTRNISEMVFFLFFYLFILVKPRSAWSWGRDWWSSHKAIFDRNTPNRLCLGSKFTTGIERVSVIDSYSAWMIPTECTCMLYLPQIQFVVVPFFEFGAGQRWNRFQMRWTSWWLLRFDQI